MDLMYIKICDPFPTAFWNCHKYFITFIDDYSHYRYLYLLHEKSQSLDMFKSEVENQLNRKIKAIRSDRGSVYYDRYVGSGRCPESFVNF